MPAISYYNATDGNLEIAFKTPNLNAWRYEIIDSKGDVGLYTSLALQPDATTELGYIPHISYYDASNMALKYAHRSPHGTGTWLLSTLEDGDHPEDYGWYTSIEVDDWGVPHISYYAPTGNDLKYATLNGVKWYKQILDSNGDVGKYTSLDLTQDGRPCISYYDVTNGALKHICSNTALRSVFLPVVIK
jgi:hypothetical protein